METTGTSHSSGADPCHVRVRPDSQGGSVDLGDDEGHKQLCGGTEIVEMKLEIEEEIDSTGPSRSKARSCLLPGEMVRQSVPHNAEPTTHPPHCGSQFESHSATVYCLAYHLTGNTHDAEDLTQDVFVQVLRYRRTYTTNTFEDRLRSATKRLFRDQVRRKQLQRDALDRGFSDRVAGLDWALDEVDNRSSDGDVRTALDALFPDLRSAVILRDIEGLSCEETAVTLGIDVGTVRGHVRRGRAQLRAALAHRAPRGGRVLPSSQTV
jgi:RNA polymerase sigma-70 factor, ECF subfamily